MTFQPGESGNPAGRPRKGTSLRELLQRRPIKDKRELIAIAYAKALEGDHHWGEWIAKHSGEGSGEHLEVSGPNGGPVVLKWDDGSQA